MTGLCICNARHPSRSGGLALDPADESGKVELTVSHQSAHQST
jgi:hypothetical protein